MIRLLVVDDYEEHRDTIANTATMYGCEARSCDSGVKALEIAQTWLPHLIIYDGLMEGMRAWQFAARYNNLPRVGVKPYMIALTGFSNTLQRRLCEEHGYDEYRTKPIELSDLLQWIQLARQRTDNAPKEPEEK